MAEPSVNEIQAHLHVHVHCFELCRAIKKATDDPHTQEALGALIDDLQSSLTTLARYSRRQGDVPGAFELAGREKAQIRAAAATRSLPEQLLAVRRVLADLVALYAAHPPSPRNGLAEDDWLVSLSARANRFLADWDNHMREMKAK
jgi:hypothetical protein